MSKAKDLLKKLKGKFNDSDAHMYTGSDISDQYSVIPTGVPSLDEAIGIGGYPVGRIIEILGWESTGKTTLALMAIANVQEMGGVAMFIDSEAALDRKYAETLGVDFDNLIVATPEYQERAFDMAYEAMREGVDIIVFDSVPAMTPLLRIQNPADQNLIGTHAKRMSENLPKLDTLIEKNGVTLIFINQWRNNPGAYGMKVTKGGNALKFYSTLRLDLKVDKIEEDANNIPRRILVEANVKKNKVSAPGRKAYYYIEYGKGVNVARSALVSAVEDGIAVKNGGWYKYEDITLGQGIDNATMFLEDNPDILEEIKNKTWNT